MRLLVLRFFISPLFLIYLGIFRKNEEYRSRKKQDKKRDIFSEKEILPQ